MGRGKGPGWWQQTRRHREAALKGQEGKRRSRHDRSQGGISQQELDRLRNWEKRNRSPWAVKMDERRTAQVMYDPRDPEQVKKWKKDPSRSDLMGVDTDAQKLYGIKLKATAEVEKRKALVKRTVEESRKRVKKAREEAKTPEESMKAEKEALEAAKTAIASATSEVKGILEGAKDEQDRNIRRFQGKWTPERKRRAETVAKAVGCSMFEADALIQRAQRAGVDYDLVDWDAIQGSDLRFSERVEKMDRHLHTETTTKAEEENRIDWQISRAEEEWQEFVTEQEQRLQEEFGGDHAAMERHDREMDRRRDEQRGYEDPYAMV